MTELTLTTLQKKLSDPEWAAARIVAVYQPSGGPGSRVYPPDLPHHADRSFAVPDGEAGAQRRGP